MFMGLKERMVAGETRDARLVFEKAGEVVVTFEIVKH
jgi:copper(I)-binding protein